MVVPPHRKTADKKTPDKILCERLSQGQEDAYEELVSLYGAALLSFGHRLGLSSQAAEDALGTAFLAVLESIDTFRGESSLKTWVYSIYRHKALGEIKANIKQTPSEDLDGFSDKFDASGSWIEKPGAWGGES